MNNLYYKTDINNTKYCVIANNKKIVMSINDEFESSEDIEEINLDSVCSYLSNRYWHYVFADADIKDDFTILANEIIDRFNLRNKKNY